MGELIGIPEVRAAAQRLGDHVVRTPTVRSPGLSAHLGAPVDLKLGLLQRTGSFKFRGALHKLLSLTDAERTAGVVAVSGGNHGIAVADAAAELGVSATVVMPDSASGWTVAAARRFGATVRRTPNIAGAFELTAALVDEG